MRSLVEMVLGGRENAKEAKKKLVQYKAKIVQEVNEESKELMRRALEEVSEILIMFVHSQRKQLQRFSTTLFLN